MSTLDGLMISRRIGPMIAACTLSGFFSACAAEPIKIGVSGAFSGSSSFLGASMRDGVRLAAAEINAKGGVLGRQIALVERDDENKVERYMAAADDLINKEKVSATIGFVNSAHSFAPQKLYQNARIPVMTSVATDSRLATRFGPPWFAENYIFKTTFSDELQAEMAVEEAVNRRKLTKVAVLVIEDLGQAGGDVIVRELGKRGMKPVLAERLGSDDDMTPGLLRARQAGAEALLVFGYAGHLGKIAGAMQKIDWRVPIIGNWPLAMPAFIKGAGAAAALATMPQTFTQDGDSARHRAFIDAYVKAFRPPDGLIPSPMSAAQGYDSLYLLTAAIRQAGTTDGPKVREALEGLTAKVEGVITTYDRPFTRDDHEAIKKPMVVMARLNGGRVVAANSVAAGSGFPR